MCITLQECIDLGLTEGLCKHLEELCAEEPATVKPDGRACLTILIVVLVFCLFFVSYEIILHLLKEQERRRREQKSTGDIENNSDDFHRQGGDLNQALQA